MSEKKSDLFSEMWIQTAIKSHCVSKTADVARKTLTFWIQAIKSPTVNVEHPIRPHLYASPRVF